MKLIYQPDDKPKFGQLIVFAIQQLLAILAATIAVPVVVGNGMSQSAALFGAGVGTLVYQLFTQFKSPVFLGSSFAFLSSMFAAFAGGVSVSLGYVGLILGAIMAGLVYVVIAIVVKFCGVDWLHKLIPPVVIGPTVAIIGLTLAGNAVRDAVGYTAGFVTNDEGALLAGNGWIFQMNAKGWLALLCAFITLAVVMLCSVYGKKTAKMVPFIIGICAGYVFAALLTVIGLATGSETLQIIDFSAFAHMKWIPDFMFIEAFKGIPEITPTYIGTIFVAYVPVAFVVFAEHLADHTNISSIIGKDLLKDPGLSRTLLGDGIGSMAGAFFGGCPNTTYGESIGCVAISGNASVITILATAILAILASFIAPFTTFLATIPGCVMGGVCISLYGFIAVSGLKMVQKVDLEDNRNLFVVSVILISGIGSLCLQIGAVKLTAVAVALILGVLTNVMLNRGEKEAKENEAKK